MGVVEALAPAELARQLAHPEGDVGLAVMRWADGNNRQADAEAVASLGIEAGSHVLEIGFGTGRTVHKVISQDVDIHYAGLDVSPTMVAEAARSNAALVEAGRASFRLGSAEDMPFLDSSFDRVFSIGVAHFWASPIKPLSEVRRVLRRGGLSLMGCLHPRSAPGFARPEYGIHLRDAAEWDAIHRAAGFAEVNVETLKSEQISPDGTTTKRYVFKLTARA